MAKGNGKRKVASGDVATNRYASYRYELLERMEGGLVLLGTEVKALRTTGAQMRDSFATLRDGEVWLHNLHIPHYAPASRENHQPDRSRKVLLHRREIDRMVGRIKERGLTLVPTRVYFSNGRAKVELALARGKDTHDKREAIKEREQKREMDRAIHGARR